MLSWGGLLQKLLTILCPLWSNKVLMDAVLGSQEQVILEVSVLWRHQHNVPQWERKMAYESMPEIRKYVWDTKVSVINGTTWLEDDHETRLSLSWFASGINVNTLFYTQHVKCIIFFLNYKVFSLVFERNWCAPPPLVKLEYSERIFTCEKLWLAQSCIFSLNRYRSHFNLIYSTLNWEQFLWNK